MKNPGMDFEIWKQLRKKWMDLDASGHSVKVDFQLIAHPTEKNNIMAIDVIQHIDGKPVTETVQHRAGEADAALGITGLSAEQLEEILKRMLGQLGSQSGQEGVVATITMTPTSSTSGEMTGILEAPGASVPVPVNYQHYYVLNALRDRMMEASGERWSRVKAVYQAGDLKFDFEYSQDRLMV
jgi:hypothetical protein